MQRCADVPETVRMLARAQGRVHCFNACVMGAHAAVERALSERGAALSAEWCVHCGKLHRVHWGGVGSSDSETF